MLANRLSADPAVRVLLLEAGGKDWHPYIRIPAAFAKQFGTKLDWEFATEPEPYADARSLVVPRGKALGGSSSMNAMLYTRGRPLDYAGWVAQGAAGWGYDDVLPYFIAAEDNVRGASEWHGVGGPLRVAEQRSPRPIGRRMIAASEAAGIPYIADYNGPEQDGVSMFQVLQSRGRRVSSADAYLHPVSGRRNLVVRTQTTVLGLALEGNRAVGVRVRSGRAGAEVIRGGEVLLAAGAIGSPQLLQLSGVGDPAELEAVGVAVQHSLPGVGKNLQDHPYVSVLFAVSDTHTLANARRPKYLAEWLLRRSGPLTSPVTEVVAFVRTRPGLPAADIQFHMGASYFGNHGPDGYDGNPMVIAPVLVTPKARGQVWLRSVDPTAKPRILTNSLSEPEDVASLVAGVRRARQIAAAEPLADVVIEEVRPGPQIEDDDALAADLRERLMLLHHPVGTCRMSDTHPGAVVDSQLRVHGTEHLRVIDASVMPIIVGGNTHAPTVMIAERAADLILGATLRTRRPAAAI